MLLLLLRIVFDPAVASYAAALLIGAPELGRELHATCMREAPRCILRGIHPRDAGASMAVWRSEMRRGGLDPFCAWHLPMPGRNFSTSGPWGAMRGHTWLHLARATGIRCAPLEVLDVPLVGAIAVGLRMQALCRRYGACDRHARHAFWAGRRSWPSAGAHSNERPYAGVTALRWASRPAR